MSSCESSSDIDPSLTATQATLIAESTLPPSSTSPIPTEAPTPPISHKTYPLNADRTYTKLAVQLPEHIYSTYGSENGLAGTVYAFSGSVTEYFTTADDTFVFESIVVDTGAGEVMVTNYYKAIYNATLLEFGPDATKSLYPYNVDNYVFPDVGDTANFIGVYMGYSKVEEKAILILGANPSIFDLLEYNDPAQSTESTVASEPVESNELSMDDVLQVIESTLKDNFSNVELLYEDQIITINLFEDGLSTAAVLAAAGSNEYCDSWNQLVESQQKLSSTIYENVSSIGFSDVAVVLNILNDLDKDKVLLTTMNGIVLYDAVNGG